VFVKLAKLQLVAQIYDRLRLAREISQDTGSRRYVSSLLDRHAGRGLDGSAHALLVLLADRSAHDI